MVVTVAAVTVAVVVTLVVVTVAAVVTAGTAVDIHCTHVCQALFQAVDSFILHKNLVRQVLFCPHFTGEETEAQGGKNVELGFIHRCMTPNIQQVLLFVTEIFPMVGCPPAWRSGQS